jgi:broad specificity phosphatase PhoE
MTGRWLLVRHGATEWSAAGRYAGWSDVPLSAAGRVQAERLAHRLAGVTVRRCFSSDLRRAKETAEAVRLGQPRSPELLLESDLRELHFGEWEGCTYGQIAGAPGGAAVLAGRRAPPGGESLDDLTRRIDRFLAGRHQPATTDELGRGEERAPPAEATLVVSHGGPLRVLICRLLGLDATAHWRFQIDQGSLSEVFWDGTTGRLVGLNDRCHLERGR